MTITATEFKTNLGQYFAWIEQNAEDLYITKNGHTVAVVSSPNKTALNALEGLKAIGEKFGKDSSKLTDEKIRNMRIEDRYGEYFD